MATTLNSKVYTITFPAGLAMSAESLAKREGRSVEELVEDAVLAYSQQRAEEFWAEIAEYAATRNPMGYTEEDVPRLIKEWRAEQRAQVASRPSD